MCTCTCRRGRSGFVNKSVERVHVQCDALPSEKWQRQRHHLPFFLTSHLTMIKITYNKVKKKNLWIPKLYLISRSSCKSDNVTIENNQKLVSFNREFDLCHILGIVLANDRQETIWFSCPPDAVPVMWKQSPHSGVFRAERRGWSSFSFPVIILISKYEFRFGPFVNSQLQIQASKSLESFVISSPFP